MAGGPVLALCASRCSGPWPFSVALRHGDQVVVDAPVPGSRADLPAHAVALCRAAGIAPQSLAEVRIDLGPGSYVGLRVAVTLARFLHREAGVRLLAATSLELMACASATRHALDGSTVHVLLDARRGRWHAQSLHVGTDHIEPRSQPHALPPAEALASLAAGSVVIADMALHGELQQAARERHLRLLAPEPVDAATLFDRRLRLGEHAAADLEPLYLMGTYADEPRA